MSDIQDLEKMFAEANVPGQASSAPEVPQAAPQAPPTPPTPPAPVVPETQPAPQPVPTAPPIPPTPPTPPVTPTVVESVPTPQEVVPPTPAPVIPETPKPVESVVVPQVPVQPTPAPVVTPQPQAVQQVPTSSLGYGSSTMNATSLSPSKVPDDFKIDLSEESKQALREVGADVGEIGMRVSRIPIEKYRGSVNKIDRISFISTSVVPVKYHYIEEKKSSIICFKGKCCSILGNPTVRYLFPIAVYQTDAEGAISGGKITLMALSAGEDLYKTIMTINKGSLPYGGIDHVDLLVTCTDEQYQKLSLVQAGPAIWRQYQPMAEFLAETYKRDGDKIYMAVARKVDEDSFLRMVSPEMSQPLPGIPQGQEGMPMDLSKYFNTQG